MEEQLGGERPQLLLAFASPHHVGACARMSSLAQQLFPEAVFAGCTGLGVIGNAHEAEEGPALSLNGAVLPRVEIVGRHFVMSSLPPHDDVGIWHERVGVLPRAHPKLMVLADPFTIDAPELVAGLDRAYPGTEKFGGLASGGAGAGEQRLLLGNAIHRAGAITVAFSGDLQVETLIAQGCRPIGPPMIVTRAREGIVLELDEGPPLNVLSEIYSSLDARDRELVQHSLFLGIEMRQDKVQFEAGELLVRNIVGVDQESGALAVGASVHPMQVIQFVLRDAHAAEQDLRQLLEQRRLAQAARPAGALLFSCTGRGSGLFGHPDHDTELFQEKLGPVPLGGFFCNGEIGPVGGSTFLHGYTSAFALFRAG